MLEIMYPESFSGVTFEIILCMSYFNHVPSGDTLCRDAISSFACYCNNCKVGIIVQIMILGVEGVILVDSSSA